MATTTLSVPNISCGHCVMTIKREVGELAGVQNVEGDADAKQVTVSFESPATLDGIKATLTEIGYPAVG